MPSSGKTVSCPIAPGQAVARTHIRSKSEKCVAGIATVIARSPTGWHSARARIRQYVAACAYGRKPNIADLARSGESGSWRVQGKIVYLFTRPFYSAVVR